MINNIVWHLEERELQGLKDHPRNPRKISLKDLDQLRASVEKFGLIDKPIINTDNVIIGGHRRKDVLDLLEIESVEVWVPDRTLSEEEVDELNIRLNRNTGEWDKEMLADSWDLNDLLDWGFSDSELKGVFDDDVDIEPEMHFSNELMLEHNYVVLYFDNPMDWEVAKDVFGLEKVKDLLDVKGGSTGLGRVINGNQVLAELQKRESCQS